MSKNIMASEVAEFVQGELLGKDCHITSPPLYNTKGLICTTTTYILCERPRLAFARVLEKYFKPAPYINPSETAVIHDCVTIGENCRIKSHAVIGEEGFGFENDETGVPMRIPHIGGVSIGNNVEIGAGTIIARGTISDTIIGNDVKIDDHVFIAHNVNIGDRTMIVAHAEISGSVVVGSDVWLGANCCIKEGVVIGDGALVGMGAVVLESVPSGIVVVGNPARFLRMRT